MLENRNNKFMLKAKSVGWRSVGAAITAPALTTLGFLTMTLPSQAISTSYGNDYRVCAAQLSRVGITPEALSQACAAALRPRDLSACVARIEQRTEIAAVDALSSCREARRPEDLAKCVVGISQSNQETANPAILDFCGRSLLPVRFAQCVVGLRAEIELATTQAMDTCIDASDRISGFAPSFIPAQPENTQIQPTFETAPAPETPEPLPAYPNPNPNPNF